jgi:Pvc16 N-terminal domain
MINEALQFLRGNLEKFISEGRVNAEPLLVLANPWSNNDSNKNSSFLNSISLINIEEEKIFKSQIPTMVRTENGQYYKKEPDLKLNLYILICAYNKNYEDGLKFISKVISYFQVNNVFTQDENQNELPKSIEKLVVELHTATFEQQNQIWASLSTGYLPSVIYKVRMLIVENEPPVINEEPLIKTVENKLKIKDKDKPEPEFKIKI